MKIWICTDLEGVAGVLDMDNWCVPTGRYYEVGKELLTMETNAAIEGFFDGGATEILVVDGHGAGAIDVTLLDPRVELARNWPLPNVYPFSLDSSFDAAAWIGQHAKAGTEHAHIAHTGSFEFLDCTINGISIGEFGELAMCATELGVRTIFGSGDEAFTKEAMQLVPGIETVSIKRGITPGSGDDLPENAYAVRNLGAIHKSPSRSRELIREGAKRAILRAKSEDFGLIECAPPYERVVRLRATDNAPKRIARDSHPSSIIELLNTPYDLEVESLL